MVEDFVASWTLATVVISAVFAAYAAFVPFRDWRWVVVKFDCLTLRSGLPLVRY